MNAAAVTTVLCPHCGAPAAFDARLNRWRPFCSERCRQADLGAWASERFRIAVDAPGADGASDGTAPPTDDH